MATERQRTKPVGYDAGQHIDAAQMALARVISETRKLINQPTSAEDRYRTLAEILAEAHHAREELRNIAR